ncbi:MAG: bifunctional demethylmenaquinone methyltransferase/2-methoxy-6-polyprenyl-1,4-benzoquinol methylase UbiE [Firmicutes bacterium]|nr:bifunctional demethylmenaquinone methyltransferase/2-methoxy-6-polyprenyl-1,4-benzoquinol methylase UbiE [Bacillota bacterium]
MNKPQGNYVKRAIKAPDRVRAMFDIVAKRYDMINRLMTMGMDKRWRKIGAKGTETNKDSIVLDACTGTGDFALAVNSVTGAKVVGVDFSADMLALAKEKIDKAGCRKEISFVEASVVNLPFEDNKFDAITIGFGLRNTPDYRAVLREFYRVTKPGGKLVCLESSQPEIKILRAPVRWFIASFVPFVGKIVSNNYQAYKYLSDSMEVFPPQKELAQMMKEAGWAEVRYRNFFAGAVALHIATKDRG